jgi:cardiolipin synthase A/B
MTMSVLPGDMNLLRQRANAPAAAAAPAPAGVQAARAEVCPSRAGTAPGINICPGSDDDGWVVPQPVTLSDGTQIRLHKDGEALHAGLEAIRDARRRICLEVYIFADDDTGHAFADALCRRARDGLRVFVIYDSFGSRGIGGREPEMFRAMRHNGVRLEQFHPMRPWECQFSWRPANRDHRKLLLVDHDIAGMGGLNVGAEYAGSWVGRAAVSGLGGGIATAVKSAVNTAIGSAAGEPPADVCDFWRDNAIGIRGPGAAPFMRAFANTWTYLTHGGRTRRAEFQHNLYEGELGVLASVPTMNSPLRPALHRLFGSARRSILMTMAYFAPDDDLIATLCRAARRGVRVRLMLPGRCDVPAVRLAARSFYQTLLDCGVEIYERQGVILHAKTMVIDGRTTVIGSTNLDYRSIEYNLELSAVIRNETFGGQMHDLFENDVRYAKRITPAEWKHLKAWDRFVQWAVSRARYLL